MENVTYPVTGPLPGRRKGRPTDQEGPSIWKDVLEGKISQFLLHKSIHIVHVEFYGTVLVGGVRRDRPGRETPDS